MVINSTDLQKDLAINLSRRDRKLPYSVTECHNVITKTVWRVREEDPGYADFDGDRQGDITFKQKRDTNKRIQMQHTLFYNLPYTVIVRSIFCLRA